MPLKQLGCPKYPITTQTARITLQLQFNADAPVRILDCGCGSSHLTFGAYHYLHNVRSLPVSLRGVDTNADLMERSNKYCRELGLQDVRFDTCAIQQYTPEATPDIILALHACDTATDDAIALGIRTGSPVIMAVPCCHKHLHHQMSGSGAPPFEPLLRHGIMKQRFADLLTDTFRASLLQVMGKLL